MRAPKGMLRIVVHFALAENLTICGHKIMVESGKLPANTLNEIKTNCCSLISPSE